MGQPKIFSLIDKAVFDYNMLDSALPDGAKILLGASGGKDSTLLAEYFSNRLKRFSTHKNSHGKSSVIPFSVQALYIQTDFASPFNPELKKKFDEWQIPLETLKVNTLARLHSGHKMSCYWCSNQRRKELLSYALQHGFDTVVLGHHIDDVLETLLMNMMEKSKLETMPPVLKYQKYPIKLIRPLYYVPVDEIIKHADEQGWRKQTCTCSYQDNSGRKEARKRLELLTGGDYAKKFHILSSLKNIDSDYLP